MESGKSPPRKTEVTLTSAAAHVLALPPGTVPHFGVVGCDRQARPFLQVRRSTDFYFTDEQRAAMAASPFYLGRDDHEAGDPILLLEYATYDPVERHIFTEPEGTAPFWLLMRTPMWRTNAAAWRDIRMKLLNQPDTPARARAIESTLALIDKYGGGLW